MKKNNQRPDTSENIVSAVKKHKKLDALSIILVAVQFLLSAFFIAGIWKLGILPSRFFIIAVIFVTISLLVVLLSQKVENKGIRITGLSFAVLLSVCMFFGVLYSNKATRMINNITSAPLSNVHSIAVAVSIDDPAESINDAASYIFGVQNQLGSQQMDAAVAEINKTVGTSVQLSNYNNLSEQVVGLQSGEVEAIIYNEAYEPNIVEEFRDYRDSVKIIYQYAYEEDSLSIQTLSNKKSTAAAQTDAAYCVFLSAVDTQGDIATTGPSDSNTLVVINPATQQILLISIPRDYYVDLPEIGENAKDKLSNTGIYGVDVSMTALSNLYDIEIDQYMRLNITSFINIIDLLGGVDIYSDLAFTTSRDLAVVKGLNKFNGIEALNYAREEWYHFTDDVNLRGSNQQAVIKAMIQKLTSSAVLTNADELMTKLGNSIDSSFSKNRLQQLISTQLDTGKEWDITSLTATGQSDSQNCYSYPGASLRVTMPDTDSVHDLKEIIQNVLDGKTDHS